MYRNLTVSTFVSGYGHWYICYIPSLYTLYQLYLYDTLIIFYINTSHVHDMTTSVSRPRHLDACATDSVQPTYVCFYSFSFERARARAIPTLFRRPGSRKISVHSRSSAFSNVPRVGSSSDRLAANAIIPHCSSAQRQ